MSTRSNIAIVTEEGKVKSIYCHFDGNPSHNGRLLLYFYNSKEAAEKIIALGDLAYLDEVLEPLEQGKPRSARYDKSAPETITTHSFDMPMDGVTIAYMRDRKEKGCEAIEYNDLSSYEPDNDFAYLFKDGKWLICDPHKGIKWVALTNEIITKDEI